MLTTLTINGVTFYSLMEPGSKANCLMTSLSKKFSSLGMSCRNFAITSNTPGRTTCPGRQDSQTTTGSYPPPKSLKDEKSLSQKKWTEKTPLSTGTTCTPVPLK